MSRAQLVYLGIGSNLGNRIDHIKTCVDLLKKEGIHILRTASVYESEPWGFVHENSFLNTVFECSTALTAVDLLKCTQQLEQQLGRTTKSTDGYSARTIDIDILLYSSEVINTTDLQVPHPLIHRRNFVLIPLNELIPSYVHPVHHRTIKELAESSTDTSKVFVVHFPLLVN
jgi:2-amino-4-hydroxy-6-hydroxymethyldihydropteridine diphosphokinase